MSPTRRSQKHLFNQRLFTYLTVILCLCPCPINQLENSAMHLRLVSIEWLPNKMKAVHQSVSPIHFFFHFLVVKCCTHVKSDVSPQTKIKRVYRNSDKKPAHMRHSYVYCKKMHQIHTSYMSRLIMRPLFSIVRRMTKELLLHPVAKKDVIWHWLDSVSRWRCDMSCPDTRCVRYQPEAVAWRYSKHTKRSAPHGMTLIYRPCRRLSCQKEH